MDSSGGGGGLKQGLLTLRSKPVLPSRGELPADAGNQSIIRTRGQQHPTVPVREVFFFREGAVKNLVSVP